MEVEELWVVPSPVTVHGWEKRPSQIKPGATVTGHGWKTFKEDFTTVWGCPFSCRHIYLHHNMSVKLYEFK